jgi:mono/diheme cytochrome c family protein
VAACSTASAVTADPPAPAPAGPLPAIPGYEIECLVGVGGMGEVYRARQLRLGGRLVALKMIRPQRSSSPAMQARFRAEAQTVALFDHPNIVRVHDSAEHEGRPYFVLEYVEGGSLADRPRDSRWAPAAAAELVASLADAVEYAHGHKVVHRDLKPANILLTPQGTPKITDFGLAKLMQPEAVTLTQSGDAVGTPVYMSPEQATGRAEEVGPATDVFGLGAILYDLLTGLPPFEGRTVAEVLEKARAGRVRPPRAIDRRVPPALERVCLRAMAADPAQRHPSAAALAQDLRRYLRRSPRRAGLRLAAAGLAVLILAGVTAALWSPPFFPRATEPRAGEGTHEAAPAPDRAHIESPAESPAELARLAQKVLQDHCYRCHGENGSVEGGFNFVLDRARLVNREKVVPGSPGQSKLFKRVSDPEDPMPPAGENPRPGPDQVALLKRWIEAGAPDFGTAASSREFISPADLLQVIREDLEKADKAERPFYRYFTITHLYNAGLSEGELQTYRVGLSKLVNSLSWRPRIVRPRPVDRARTVFRIDLRNYERGQKVWEAVLAAYPYGVGYQTDAARFCSEQTGCPLPYVRADWFVFAASRPPLYHEVLNLPGTAGDLEKLLHVDAAENVRQRNVARAGFNDSGVSRNNRLIERHDSIYGYYWKSYDFKAPLNAPTGATSSSTRSGPGRTGPPSATTAANSFSACPTASRVTCSWTRPASASTRGPSTSSRTGREAGPWSTASPACPATPGG